MNNKQLKSEINRLKRELESLKTNKHDEIRVFKSEPFTIRQDHENIFAWFALSKTHECFIVPDEDRNFVCFDISSDDFSDMWTYLDLSNLNGDDAPDTFPTFVLDMDIMKSEFDFILLNSNKECEGVYKIEKVNSNEYKITPQIITVNNSTREITLEDE